MAVGILNRFPEGAGANEYDAVQGKLGTKENPPAGLILHSAGELEGQFQVFDIWESREQYDQFVEERLRPAMKEAMGEEVYNQMPPAQNLEAKIHNYEIP
jgi:hypothetical protein